MKTAEEFYIEKINPDSRKYVTEGIHRKIVDLMEQYGNHVKDSIKNGEIRENGLIDFAVWYTGQLQTNPDTNINRLVKLYLKSIKERT